MNGHVVIQHDLVALLDAVRSYSGIVQKHDIQLAASTLAAACPADFYPNGDDCAVLPNGDGYSLFAIEGFIQAFVEHDPWFAGWCGVMVNISDIAAMGGYPLAVVNALWSAGEGQARQMLVGMAAASHAYGVPIVGGHTNLRSKQSELAVSIYGRAKAILSSFAATPDQVIVAAIDLRGQFRAPYLNWNAATTTVHADLRRYIGLLPLIAEQGLATACKDISNAGLLGTLTMLLESSCVGAEVRLADIPKPVDVTWRDWLCAFPSYGYLLTTSPDQLDALLACFLECGIAASAIGTVTDSGQLQVSGFDQQGCFWDCAAAPLTGMQSTPSTYFAARST